MLFVGSLEEDVFGKWRNAQVTTHPNNLLPNKLRSEVRAHYAQICKEIEEEVTSLLEAASCFKANSPVWFIRFTQCDKFNFKHDVHLWAELGYTPNIGPQPVDCFCMHSSPRTYCNEHTPECGVFGRFRESSQNSLEVPATWEALQWEPTSFGLVALIGWRYHWILPVPLGVGQVIARKVMWHGWTTTFLN